jgi:transcriptional regulator with XRE-family HTH domain
MVQDKHLKKLGLAIRKIRLSKKLTQSKLAAMIDKDQQSIQRLEKGRVNQSYLYLLEICEGLEVALEEVLESIK